MMTLAVAKALLRSHEEQVSFRQTVVEEMQRLGREYPHPKGSYGFRLFNWLNDPSPKPYGSFGNGSAMRVSPCRLIAVTENFDQICMHRRGSYGRCGACSTIPL